MTLRWKQVEISGGFLLLAAMLYYLDDQSILPWAFCACACHELGHYGVIRLLGGQVTLLRITCVGAEMRLSARQPLRYGGQILAALAGPAANLVAAIFSARLAAILGEGLYLFAGLNLALCAFNLLPVAQLDGGRILWHVLALLFSQTLADMVLRAVSLGLTVALMACGVLLLWENGANFTLFITASWLILSLTGERVGKRVLI